MCFTIKKGAKAPKNRIAWKVMRITSSGLLRSFIYDGGPYEPGQVVHRSKGPTSIYGYSRNGMYVYLNERYAEQIVHNWPNEVVVRVKVSSKDFLHLEKNYDEVATYEKITICEDQPYFDWV